MPDSFKLQNLPFSLLNEKEQRLLSANLDLGYYSAGEMILKAGEQSEVAMDFFIISSGLRIQLGQTDGVFQRT